MGPRAAEYRDIEMQPGFYSNDSGSGTRSLGRWIGGDKVRFGQSGRPEKMAGWQRLDLTVGDNLTSAVYQGAARSGLQWSSLDGERWFAFGTQQRLYLINNDELHNITPIRATTSPDNPFSTVNGDATVTVTHSTHGAAVGDIVTISGFSSVGGLDMNGEHEVTEIVDTNNYRFEHTSTATSTAGPGGGTSGTIVYEINSGNANNAAIGGYGVGPYGGGGYGVAGATTYVSKIRVWSLQRWGEDLLASPNGRTLYWWDRTNGTGTRATEVTQAPDNIEHMIVLGDDRTVMALGMNPAGGGNQDKMLYGWCDAEDFTTWVAAPDNSAGSRRLDDGSRIVTGVLTTGGVNVFTDTALYFLQNVGPPYYFGAPRHVAGGLSIMGANAAVDVDGVTYWMGFGNFYVAEGGVVRAMPCDVWTEVFENYNKSQSDKCFAGSITARNEIWWLYASAASSEPDRYVVYNYLLNCWYTGTMNRTMLVDSNVLKFVPIGLQGGYVYLHESGVDDHTSALTAYIESHGIRVAGESGLFMLVNDMVPDFDTLIGSTTFEVTNLRRFPQSTAMTAPASITVTASTEHLPVRFRSAEARLRVSSSAVGDWWRMSVWQALATPYGKR